MQIPYRLQPAKKKHTGPEKIQKREPLPRTPSGDPIPRGLQVAGCNHRSRVFRWLTYFGTGNDGDRIRERNRSRRRVDTGSLYGLFRQYRNIPFRDPSGNDREDQHRKKSDGPERMSYRCRCPPQHQGQQADTHQQRGGPDHNAECGCHRTPPLLFVLFARAFRIKSSSSSSSSLENCDGATSSRAAAARPREPLKNVWIRWEIADRPALTGCNFGMNTNFAHSRSC